MMAKKTKTKQKHPLQIIFEIVQFFLYYTELPLLLTDMKVIRPSYLNLWSILCNAQEFWRKALLKEKANFWMNGIQVYLLSVSLAWV